MLFKAPYRCVHDKALYKYTFTFTFTTTDMKFYMNNFIEYIYKEI